MTDNPTRVLPKERRLPKPGTPLLVVGVDGTPGSLAALEWAAGEARRRGDAVLAVRVWQFPVNASGFLTDDSIEAMQSDEEEQLELDLFDVLGDNPGVDVYRLVTSGAATKTLFTAAQGADMLVIGSKGHRGLTNVVIGSVSAQVTHYAPCPVVIVPQRISKHEDSGSVRPASDGAG